MAFWSRTRGQLDVLKVAPAEAGPLLAVWPRNGDVAGNWGDKLNPCLMTLLSGRPTLHTHDAPEMREAPTYRVIGSGLASSSGRQVVWGSGFMNANDRVKAVAGIHAVRGPHTRARLIEQGIACPEVYGDPALLMPIFYRPSIAKTFDLGIIQHFRDAGNEPLPAAPRGLEVLTIDICGSITGVIDAILSCRQIASSSLHGLIAAHAYGVPATWIRFGDRPLGDGFKFRDYWASMGRDDARAITVTREMSCGDLVGPLATTTPRVDVAALLHACPFIDERRKAALLDRAARVLPRLPDAAFLAAAA